MIRTNITDIHMNVQEATSLADLMEENGRTSLSAALDVAVANATDRPGVSAHVGLIIDNDGRR